jgi:KUP system potassium uptake protein
MENNKHIGHISKISFASLLMTLGIVYGDIGTSPLYTMKAIIGEGNIIGKTAIFGAVSLIFWTLTLQTTIKYVMITLKADNNGEGGIFSLYAILRKRAKWLMIPAMIGGAALLADGIITPPISVTSAIEGIDGIIDLSRSEIIIIVIAIITFLFFLQRFGTEFIGRSFGPVMLIWFTMLAVLGGIQILQHPQILVSLNPYYGFIFLITNPLGILILGAVFLCTTGAEALYSDLGHCGRRNIYLTWIFVKFTLVINYLGQGAWLLSKEGMKLEENPFFSIMPKSFLIIGIVIATLATIIASQALISGSFTLVSEAIRLNFLPRIFVRYPTDQKGQLYIPAINLLLWMGCCAIVLYFKESTKMEAAYGLSITITMLMTTVLLSQYLVKKHINKYLIIGFTIMYVCIEGVFLTANLFKFLHGGYITILIALSIISLMYIWIKGYSIKTKFRKNVKIKDFVTQIDQLRSDTDIPKYATNLVYMSNATPDDEVEDKIMYSILNKLPKRAAIYWFVNVQVTDTPFTTQFKVNKVSDFMYKITFFLGFRVNQKINIFLREVITDLLKSGELRPKGNIYSALGKNTLGDFAFVLIREELSNQVELNIWEELIMRSKLFIKRIAITPQKWFGLDTSTVTVETVPMIRGTRRVYKLQRVK